MITTELHPEWNLAGWTGPATNISAVLEATPQLEAIYSWDGKTQSFRGAIRAKSGIDGSLKALEPGMGLWLYIGGTERVSWTRPFLTESALVSLAEGWNLMSWGGRDGASPEDILNPLGAELVLAATWDATTGQFLLSSTATPATSNTLHEVRRGDALWLSTPAAGSWLQPGRPTPEVVLLGDFATGTEDRYRRNVEESQVFFAERYGVITSDVTFYFASDRESLVDTYRQVRGRDPASNLCADSTGNAIFIATYRCFPVAHEYFHSIQQYLSGDTYRGSPTWIVEGSAVYTDFQRRYSRGIASYEEAYHFIWSSLGIELDSETAATMRASIANSIGYLAMEWLADEAGEAAIVDYFGALKSAEDWETAFERAFGLSVSEFYSRFEAYRLEVAPPFEWEIRGTVLDRDSQPLEGARVFAAAGVIGQRFSTLSTVTGSDGSFSISAGPGTGYVLLVRGHCPDGAFHYIGAQGEDGFTTDWRNAPPFTGEDRNRTGITITLPVTLAEFERDNCAS